MVRRAFEGEAAISVADDALQETQDLLSIIVRSLDDDKAVEPVTIDLSGKTTVADAMVIASGTSQRHIAAMAEKLLERLKRTGRSGLKVEGGEGSDWVLIDVGDVIVHLFKPEARSFYNLEKLWEAPAVVQASRASA